MATYSYSKTGNGNILVDLGDNRVGTFTVAQFGGFGIGNEDNEPIRISFPRAYEISYNPETDTLILDGVTYAPGSQTKAEIVDILNASPVFLKPSSGGGGGSFATITGQPTDNANLKSFVIGLVAPDYVLERKENTYIATPSRDVLPVFSGSAVHMVINNCADELGGQGHIAAKAGIFNLTDTVLFKGQSEENPPRKQIILSGQGSATTFNLFDAVDKNAFKVNNKASFCFKDFYIAVNSANLSAIILDDDGDSDQFGECSSWNSHIENIFVSSDSNKAPAVLMKNFWDLSIPSLSVVNSVGSAIEIVNNSESTNFGNSHWGYIKGQGGDSLGCVGLKVSTTNNNNFPNLTSIAHFESIGTYKGIETVGARSINFGYVDIEFAQICIDVSGSDTNGTTRGLSFDAGYLLPRGGGGIGIKTSIFSGGNIFDKIFISGDQNVIPIQDQSQYRLPNSYNILLDSSVNESNISITEENITELNVKKTNGATAFRKLVRDTYSVTPQLGDSSKKVANTEFVANALGALGGASKRTVYLEAQGNNTTINLVGLGSNGQGTNTVRNVASTNVLTRTKRIGKVSATTANARAGELGNNQFFTSELLTFRAVFAIQSYNAGHTYNFGVEAFNGSPNNAPSTFLNTVHMYADAGDTTFKIRGADGGTLGTVIELGANFPCNTSNTDIYDLTLTIVGGSCQYTVKRLNTGDISTGTISVIPSTGVALNHVVIANNLATGVASAIDIARISWTTDY